MKMKKLGILLFVIVFTFVSSMTVNATNLAEYQQEMEETSKNNQEEGDETSKNTQEEKEDTESNLLENKQSENDQEENKQSENDQEENGQKENKQSELSNVQTQADDDGIAVQANQTAQFEVKNKLLNYPDFSKQFTYDLTLTDGSSDFSGELAYEIYPFSSGPLGDSYSLLEESGKLEVIDGKATFSLRPNRAFIIKRMPVDLSYTVKLREEAGYTINDKSQDTGVTNTSPTTVTITSEYIYDPVDYSFETDIVAAIEGREFKSGDSFSYTVTPESEYAPVVMGYEISSNPIEKVEMDTFTLNPTSGYTYPYSLKAEIKNVGCMLQISDERRSHFAKGGVTNSD